jgi:hypothetical protein
MESGASVSDKRLLEALEGVRRRVLTVGVTSGGGWGIAGLLLLLMLFAWGDLALNLAPAVRLTCVFTSIAFGAALLLHASLNSYRASNHRSVARRIDQVSRSGGQILSGVDLFQQFPGHAAAPTLSGALASMAVDRATQLAARVGAATAVPAKPLVLPFAALGSAMVILGVVALAAPRLLATQWSRFTDPFGDHPPYSSIEFKVEPGNTRIIYGAALDVRATPVGGAVEHVQLTFHPDGQSEESVPMFPETGGTWRATVSQITADGTYYVQGSGATSRRFHFSVITVPELRDVRVRITPPAYTHLPPYNGPVPERGIVGLAGTKVEMWAKSNRPLSGGTIAFVPGAVPTTQPVAPPAPVALAPIAPDAAEVLGSFVIATPGKLRLTIIDTANQPSREPYTAAVTVLKDERPFVRILEPKESAFATPDAKIDVNIAAEDDYGISSLQLFRGLNDARATAGNLPIPPGQPTHVSTVVPIDLGQYGLTPGDVLKLYARVEDNDPAGAKGSESPVVTVRVISNEDFNRMVVAREGLETLEAKYAMAARRLEALDNQIAAKQAELKALPPDSKLSKEAKEALKKLERELKESADEVAEAAKEQLPFDVDKEFNKKLEEMAKAMADAAKATEEAGQGNPSAGKTGEKLDDIRNKLGGKREEFKKQVAQPLDNLDKIFPLIEDQARYVELWERQKDLAERMKSAAPAKPDDPKAKARMRDLETEQRRLSQDLNDLLRDIKDHAEKLPSVVGPFVRAKAFPAPVTLASALAGVLAAADAPAPNPDELKDDLGNLKQSALDFVRDVRDSGALEKMNDAAADLGAFDGATAAGKAQEAADIMKEFIEEANAMGGKARGLAPLAFAPNLVHPMGATIDQLLAAEGMQPGGGSGASGGFSQRRSSLRNTSLYGRIPSRSQAAGTRRGASASGPGTPGSANGTPGQSGGRVDSGKLQASGESDVAVPSQYRQKVGEYFQRVADELGQE